MLSMQRDVANRFKWCLKTERVQNILAANNYDQLIIMTSIISQVTDTWFGVMSYTL